MSKEVSTQANPRVSSLEAAIEKANEAAAKLLRCAESISNPTYSVSMQGHKGDLTILSVRHFQGQICIMVKDVNVVDSGHRDLKVIGQAEKRVGFDPKLLENVTDV